MNVAEKDMNKYSDEELMVLVCDRNSKALKVLYDRYCKSIFTFILRFTNNREISEDILQETFTRSWFAAHTFNPEKGSYKSWLFTIGINATRNEMTKKRYSYNHIDLESCVQSDEDFSAADDEPVENFLEHSEIKDTISKAVELLNPFLKEVVILKHYQGMKFSEISEITNTPEGTLKARFHNALIQLKKMLQKGNF